MEIMVEPKNKTIFTNILLLILKKLWGSFKDLLSIIIVIAFFQIVVLRQPLPNFVEVVFGGLFIVFGLMLFVQGLEMGRSDCESPIEN